ncbi:uncharacterized protein LOC108847839 [Raphanus sativus]|uniref:Uncharacterized protein LOC108847839 n=1 Tax=Raphanus sativus TaxID=3726 RepID=A0A9W3C469_RAPSA|nr:uncharacterized protein LOC108847839 [Raphanus sativus]
MNPRVEHCNATELICEKSEEKEADRLFPETALGVEERTEQSARSEVTVPEEPAKTPPALVYIPKVPYPIPPRHLMDPISAEQLAGFRKMIRPLLMFFKNSRETQEEIKALFTEALTPSLKVLPKVDDPGKFAFPCSIAEVEFKEDLCDSGSCVNLVSRAIVDKLGIADVEPSHVVEMRKDHEMPLILGRIFMATMGAIIDMPKKRVSFSNINKKVSTRLFPPDCTRCTHLPS